MDCRPFVLDRGSTYMQHVRDMGNWMDGDFIERGGVEHIQKRDLFNGVQYEMYEKLLPMICKLKKQKVTFSEFTNCRHHYFWGDFTLALDVTRIRRIRTLFNEYSVYEGRTPRVMKILNDMLDNIRESVQKLLLESFNSPRISQIIDKRKITIEHEYRTTECSRLINDLYDYMSHTTGILIFLNPNDGPLITSELSQFYTARNNVINKYVELARVQIRRSNDANNDFRNFILTTQISSRFLYKVLLKVRDLYQIYKNNLAKKVIDTHRKTMLHPRNRVTNELLSKHIIDSEDTCLDDIHFTLYELRQFLLLRLYQFVNKRDKRTLNAVFGKFLKPIDSFVDLGKIQTQGRVFKKDGNYDAITDIVEQKRYISRVLNRLRIDELCELLTVIGSGVVTPPYTPTTSRSRSQKNRKHVQP